MKIPKTIRTYVEKILESSRIIEMQNELEKAYRTLQIVYNKNDYASRRTINTELDLVIKKFTPNETIHLDDKTANLPNIVSSRLWYDALNMNLDERITHCKIECKKDPELYHVIISEIKYLTKEYGKN